VNSLEVGRLPGARFVTVLGPENLRKLLDAQYPALVLYARQWCDSPEDAVGEALLALVQQKDQPRDFLPWLYRVVRNAAVSAARAGARRQRHESGAAQQTATWFVPRDDDRLDAAQAAQALSQLPYAEREIVVSVAVRN
jgi:RNA polymerase sigma-70 factor (ECF subfamily)